MSLEAIKSIKRIVIIAGGEITGDRRRLEKKQTLTKTTLDGILAQRSVDPHPADTLRIGEHARRLEEIRTQLKKYGR